MRFECLLLTVFLTPLWAQELTLPPDLERLADHAEESVRVTLDGPLLQLAAKVLSDEHGQEANVKKLISGLQGIYVRSFKFNSAGAYNPSDLDSVRAQFRGSPWSQIVGVKSRDDGDVDVYCKISPEGRFQGVVVIAAEKHELTFVNIQGDFDPARLADLGDEFGIPRLHMTGKFKSGRGNQ